MLQICNFKNQLKFSFKIYLTGFNMLCFIKPCLCASHDWLDDPLSHMRCLKENPMSASRNCSHSTQCQRTIYSATYFREKCRKGVREIWFEKYGSRKMVDQKKRWFYTINPHFFRFKESGWPEKKNPSLHNHFSRTTFLHFSTLF